MNDDDALDLKAIEAKAEWAESLSVGQLKLWTLGDAARGADLPRLAKLSGLPLEKLQNEADFIGSTDDQYAEMLVSNVTMNPEKAANRAAVAVRAAHIELMSNITEVHVEPDSIID
ncbi:hypothetical protein ACUWEX_11120 [Okibacterium fritillariae]|uniref:hypothetical protein n=1 Tax=Okibacterium fritillariae TaxID=123320 RepID=UPI0040553D9F